MYKMFDIGKENNDIEVIVDDIGTLWLNEKHIEEKLGHKNLPVITNKYDPVYKKRTYELVNKVKKQPNRRFLRSDLALKMMDCRTDESCSHKRNLGFRIHDVINTKEKRTVLKSIKDAFEREDMQTQYSALGYHIDLYFHKYQLAMLFVDLGNQGF